MLPLTAQSPPAGRRAQTSGPAVTQDAKPGAIRGTVVGTGGEPLRKATVMISSRNRAPGRNFPIPAAGGMFTATTDTAGVFAVEGIPPGNYVISVRRTGYVPGEYGAKSGTRGSAATVAVGEGQEVTGITIRLVPQAVLAGKIVDEDGDPVQFASVQVLRERWMNGRRQHMPMSSDATNDLGEYRIANLTPGRYHLMVTMNRQAPDTTARRAQNSAGDLAYTPIYYPGVTEISQATPIQLQAGQEMRGVDLQIRKTNTWRIRGRVLDESGKPAMYVGVMATPADGAPAGVRSMGMVRNPEGTFEIAGLPPGSYNLMVNRAGREEPRTSARTTVQLGSRDLDGVVIQLQPTFQISGFFKVAGDNVQVSSARVVLDPLESGLTFYGGNDGQVKPDGSWTLSGISPGRYRVTLASAGLPQDTYLKSVTVGGQDIMGGASITGSATGIEITLAGKAPELSGTVLNSDKQPVSGCTVVVVPESSKRDQYWLFKTTASDDSGTFSFKGLRPGQYTVYALIDPEDGIWNSPEFLATIEGKGAAVKLEEASKETVQLSPVS